MLQFLVKRLLNTGKSSFLNLVAKGHKKTIYLDPKKTIRETIKEELNKARNSQYLKDKVKRALRKPNLREQGKRLTKKSTLKGAFRTLSWKYIKQQLWFARNQGKLRGPILSASKTIQPVADARKVEQSIMRRLILTNKRQVIDRSPLNSSWCHSGMGIASTAQEDYGLGTLFLTVKHEYKDGRVVIGKTYTYHNFPLTSGSLMRAALGRDGTGAGSVYGQTYIRGGRSGKEVRASRGSEEVVIRNRQ